MTCYAPYDDQAPTYYCTRPSGHDGWHAATEDDIDLYQEWPRSLEDRRSSQAGITTFRTHYPNGTRIWLCPKCNSRLDHGYTRGEGWESCTNDDCNYELGMD